MKSKVSQVIEAISNSYGNDYFTKITFSLHQIIAADYTFIAKYNPEKHSNKTIVLVAKGVLAINLEYPLAGAPCENTLNGSACYYLNDVCKTFPKASTLSKLNIQAYVSVPLINSKKEVIGILTALYESPLTGKEDVIDLFELFSSRIAAELERLDYEKGLESKLAKRNKELSNIIEELKSNQKQLIESEKMATLGNLVAGVTHEVNTPLGIAITTHSIMVDELAKLNDKISHEKLTLKDMSHYRRATEDALAMQGDNLNRAKKLIENFKKTAVDQHQLDIETINIEQYYQQIISTLRSLLKPKNAAIALNCPQSIVISTCPGVHGQILTNLISNSMRHAFTEITPENKITISVHQDDKGEVVVHYADNGIGLTEEAKQRVFEPFFTTARNKGGIGLGMSIIFELITNKLHGNISIESVEKGAGFKYTFKESTPEN